MEQNQAYQIDKKMDWGKAIAYTLGSAGSNASFYIINTYLMVFYTDVVGLSAAAISLIMLIARVWDAVNDPMMGVICDRTKTRFGKFRPWLMIGPPFLAVFNILTFTAWPMEGATKAIVCGICYIGAGMAYTVVGTAINGLVNRLTNNPEFKLKLVTWSQIGNQVVNALISAVTMPLILYFSKSDRANGRGYFLTTIIISVITCSIIFIAAIRCKEVKVPGEDENAGKKNEKKESLATSLKALMKNKPLVIAIFSVFFVAFGNIARGSMMSYYLIYCAGSYEMIAPVMTIQTIGVMVGNFPLQWIAKKLGKKNTFLAYLIIMIASMAIWFFIPMSSSMILFMFLNFWNGFGSAGLSISYAFICDSIEYGDLKYNVRDEGLAFSSMSFMVKLAGAFVGTVGVMLLSAVGFVANAQQSAATLTGINAIVNIMPTILVTLGVIVVGLGYKFTDDKVAVVTEELMKKRNGQPYNVIDL